MGTTSTYWCCIINDRYYYYFYYWYCWLFILIATAGTSFGAHVDISPTSVVVLPGQSATFLCQDSQREHLEYCRAEIQGMQPLRLKEQSQGNEVQYYGRGLNYSHCGFVITNVQEKNNGQVRCTMGVPSQQNEISATAHLIVAKAPSRPEIDIIDRYITHGVYKINDVLKLRCDVNKGRPVANITWYLDGEPIYGGRGNEISSPINTDSAKEDLHSKSVNLTRELRASDNGRLLKCVAFHMAYANGTMETGFPLEVSFAPLPQRDMDKFGYIIGRPGAISVEIEANPQPKIEWRTNGEVIYEGQSDRSGRLFAESPVQKGNARYYVTLRIESVTKNDTAKTYILTAYNSVGSQAYRIHISNSPEPEGIELGVGAITGIIVSIFIILLVAIILIFAKITGKWCFTVTGGQNRETRNLAESDTESAEVKGTSRRQSCRRTLLANIKLASLFRPAKNDTKNDANKTAAENAENGGNVVAAEGPTAETEGTIVYAELDLANKNKTGAGGPKSTTNKGSGAASKPSATNTTEYAEIVYKTAAAAAAAATSPSDSKAAKKL